MLQLSGDARFTNKAVLAFFISKPDKYLESDAAAKWLIYGFQYLAHSATTDFPSAFVSALVDLLRKIGHCASLLHGPAGLALWAIRSGENRTSRNRSGARFSSLSRRRH